MLQQSIIQFYVRLEPSGLLLFMGVPMVHEGQLPSVLSELASTLLTDFPIQSILNHLVDRILDVLPVSAVGITLISPGVAPLYVAASDDSALRFETLQTELKQGPCILAYTSGEAVSVPDLTCESRFPEFVACALPAGMAAVFTFPLRHGEDRIGALDLYRATPGRLTPTDLVAAQTLADVAAAYVLNAQARDDARATSDSFQNSALHDPLTGLPNRLLLQQRLSHAEANQDRPVSLSLRETHQPEVLRPLQRATRQGSRKGAAANGRCASSTPM
jgi:GAF domain-containing protein